MERPPTICFLAPRLNFRFAFRCPRSCASLRFASSTVCSTSSGPKACLTLSKSETVPRKKANHTIQEDTILTQVETPQVGDDIDEEHQVVEEPGETQQDEDVTSQFGIMQL